MTRLLPFIILSLVIRYLSLTTFTFAQEVTPVITSSPQVNPLSTSAWDDFLKNFIPGKFKIIPDTLQQVNCSNLPLDACNGIESTSVKKETDKSGGIKPQANDEGEKKKIVSDTAGQYTIASGVNTPVEVSNASTNMPDMFAGFINFFDQIFNKGNIEAQNFAGVALPQSAASNLFVQKSQNNFADLFQDKKNTAGIVNFDPNILGASDIKTNTVMEQSLPLRQCAQLPAGLCNRENKINFGQ